VVETVNRSLCDFHSLDVPFSGITVVLGGDFQQTLPVIIKATHEETILAMVQWSHLWHNICLLHLKENMRLNHDRQQNQFAHWLLQLGHGSTVDMNTGSASIYLPPNIICKTQADLICFLYGTTPYVSMLSPQYFYERVLLAPLNDDDHKLNMHILNLFPGHLHTYSSANTQVIEAGTQHSPNLMPVEFLNSLNSSGLPLAHLELKLGCPIILLCNLDHKHGLCNGSRATVVQMSNRVLQVRLLGGDHDSENAFIPRITLSPPIHGLDFTIHLKQRQFPVQLTFAMTINRS